MNLEHPPLAKVLAALPLVLRGVHADYSHLFLDLQQQEYQRIPGRVGVRPLAHHALERSQFHRDVGPDAHAVLTLLLGLAIYRFWLATGRRLGRALSLCVYASMPAFLAFGPLA